MLLTVVCISGLAMHPHATHERSVQGHLCCLCRRGLQQFTPSTFEIFDWAMFSSPMRFVQALTLVAVTLAFELNAFFLKTLLWLPPPHFLNVSRLLFLWLLALPAAKEYHAFLEVRRLVCSIAASTNITRDSHITWKHDGTRSISASVFVWYQCCHHDSKLLFAYSRCPCS